MSGSSTECARQGASNSRRFRVALREFLNLPGWHGRASLIAEVENTSRLRQAELRFRREPEVFLCISDCSNQCEFAFDLATAAGQRNSLHKVDVLLAGLERFREALVVEIELFNERQETIWSRR